MSIHQFILNLASQFDQTLASQVQPDTVFKQLDDWSSLTALSVIAMVDEEYDVILRGNDILQADTVQDLYDAVQAKR